MQIKIGDKIYSPDDQPISIYLSDQDKELIASMQQGFNFFTAAPDGADASELEEFVEDFKKSVENSSCKII